ncbi:MAG: hypothetical protein C0402_03235 [Thermodesulfovibrio sp.]|nr:hypothetical protein [Thermodesulfovibrio sp.]
MKIKEICLATLLLLLSACTGLRHEILTETGPQHRFEADYYYMLGYEAFISGDWDNSLANYKQALEFDPKSPYLKAQIGHFLLRKGDIPGALSMAASALGDHPDHIRILMLQAEILDSQKRGKELAEILDRIRKLSPEDPEVMMFVGKVYYNNDLVEDALDAFNKVVQKDPDEFVALDYIGSIYLDRKEYTRAEEYLKRVLEIRQLEGVYFKLGIIREMLERYPEALADYETTLRHNPLHRQARERIAQIYVKQKSLGKAIDEFLILSSQQPENVDMHVRLGLLYYETRAFERSLDEFRTALAGGSEKTAVRYYLALVLEEMDRFDEALAEFKKIIIQEPKNVNAFLHLAIIYSKQKKDDEAIKMFEEVLAFDKDKPEIFLSLAMAHLRTKAYVKAEAVLLDAIVRFKDNEELYFNLAMVYDKAERFDAMVGALKKTLELNPRNADALNYLGYYYADKNMNLQEARELIERALAVKPDNGYILDSYGWVLYRLGNFEQAIEQLEKAVTITTEDPMLFEHMGDVYHALHKREKALEHWRRSLKNHEKEEGLKERVEKKIQEFEKNR